MRNPMVETMKEVFFRGLEEARRLGASAAKLKFFHKEKIAAKFEAGRLKETGSEERLSYAVHVLCGGRMGAASGNRLDDLQQMIGRAVSLARVGRVAHFDEYPPPREVTSVRTHSERTRSLTRDHIIEGCGQIAGSLKGYDSDLFVTCSATRLESESLLVTSGGVCHGGMRTQWALGGFAQRTRDTDMVFAGYGRAWCDLNPLYAPGEIAARIITDLRRAEKGVPPPTGSLKAYLPPETLRMFIYPIHLGIHGRNVAKGESPLQGRLEEQVLAPTLSIMDVPHQEFAPRAAEMDEDGIATQELVLFQGGVLKRFLYDLDSAGLAGERPTGNSGCAPYNSTVLPGDCTSEDLLSSVEDGIYIRSLMGFGQGNIGNGDFSANLALGYRIEKGEITGRVKDTMVAGNVYELLKGQVFLSSDLDYDGRFPHAVIEGVQVSSKER